MAAPKVFMYNVEMTCEGCVNAVSNVLKKHKEQGVDNFEISLKDKTVAVTSSLDENKILEIIKKTGKSASYIGEK